MVPLRYFKIQTLFLIGLQELQHVCDFPWARRGLAGLLSAVIEIEADRSFRFKLSCIQTRLYIPAHAGAEWELDEVEEGGD